jgi:hypothetical protein
MLNVRARPNLMIQHSSANAHNSQSGGQFVGGNSAFNAGLGGDHASAGIPKDGSHPIADKFMGQSGEQDTVSGSYGGGSTRDALAGQSESIFLSIVRCTHAKATPITRDLDELLDLALEPSVLVPDLLEPPLLEVSTLEVEPMMA